MNTETTPELELKGQWAGFQKQLDEVDGDKLQLMSFVSRVKHETVSNELNKWPLDSKL